MEMNNAFNESAIYFMEAPNGHGKQALAEKTKVLGTRTSTIFDSMTKWHLCFEGHWFLCTGRVRRRIYWPHDYVAVLGR